MALSAKTDLLDAAENVKRVFENEEALRYYRLTQAELDKLHTYQFTTPTAPQPGFQYKREYWRIPGELSLWCAPNESHVRVAIGEHTRKAGERLTAKYDGPLESTWFVFTCEHDPKSKMYVVHLPKEAKVIQ